MNAHSRRLEEVHQLTETTYHIVLKVFGTAPGVT